MVRSLALGILALLVGAIPISAQDSTWKYGAGFDALTDQITPRLFSISTDTGVGAMLSCRPSGYVLVLFTEGNLYRPGRGFWRIDDGPMEGPHAWYTVNGSVSVDGESINRLLARMREGVERRIWFQISDASSSEVIELSPDGLAEGLPHFETACASRIGFPSS